MIKNLRQSRKIKALTQTFDNFAAGLTFKLVVRHGLLGAFYHVLNSIMRFELMRTIGKVLIKGKMCAPVVIAAERLAPFDFRHIGTPEYRIIP